jgi:hypothetical protein
MKRKKDEGILWFWSSGFWMPFAFSVTFTSSFYFLLLFLSLSRGEGMGNSGEKKERKSKELGMWGGENKFIKNAPVYLFQVECRMSNVESEFRDSSEEMMQKPRSLVCLEVSSFKK